MDPISLIIAALVAGATTGITETATDAIKDTYAGFKALLLRRLKGEKDAAEKVEAVEAKPEADHSELAEHLKVAGADADEELVNAARRLLETVDPAGAQAGKYTVTVTGGKGVVVGDNANVTQTFND